MFFLLVCSLFIFLFNLHGQIEKRHELAPVECEGTSARSGCIIFFGYTSNMVSSGLRENIRFLAQHKMVRSLCFSWNLESKNTVSPFVGQMGYSFYFVHKIKFLRIVRETEGKKATS